VTFDLLTVKVVSESRVTWAISVPSLVLLGLSVLINLSRPSAVAQMFCLMKMMQSAYIAVIFYLTQSQMDSLHNMFKMGA